MGMFRSPERVTFSPPKKSPKSRQNLRFWNPLFVGAFYKANCRRAPIGTLFVLSRTDFPRMPAPGGPRRAQGRALIPRSFGTMLVAGIGKFRKCRAGGAGTLSGQFSLRVSGQAFPTSPFLFWGSLKPRFLFRREREKAVSGRLPAPERGNTPARRRRKPPPDRRQNTPDHICFT